jgi:UDP-N-acetylmuramyl pentapeptide phosphotransferase/UDP-N-acetylglucosamine-1-phosphate transferase
LPARNPAISPWTSIVVCAYPVIEVLFSIMRRRHRARHPSQPDLLHLHSLIYRRVMRNHARTTALVGVLVGAPALAGVCLAHHSISLYAAFGLSALSYGLIYGRLVGFRWCAFKR